MKVALIGTLIALLVLLVIVLNGCGSGTVITSLELVTDAAEAAVTVLAATGQLPASTVTVIDSYLSQVSTATEFAVTELESTDPAGAKASKILAQFAMIARPDLPPGIAQAILAAVQAVASSVSNFLMTLQPAPAPGTPPTAALKPPDLKLTRAIVHASKRSARVP